MISFEEAKKIALNNISSDCDILPDSIIEKPYGWYFNFQGKKFIETGSLTDMLVGNGGFIVEKDCGKVIQFGSAYSIEKNFEIYEKGFLKKNLDLIITKVFDFSESVRLLKRLSMTYLGKEVRDGIEWKIPKIYNEKQVKNALLSLPYTFHNQNFYFRYDEFQKIDDSKCFQYELRKHRK